MLTEKCLEQLFAVCELLVVLIRKRELVNNMHAAPLHRNRLQICH